MDKKTGESKLQKAARQCQYGVIGSLEKFFQWYGSLIATYPKHAILVSITITVLGGLGLFRFYEEGDAASMVIPRKSDFRKNIDWIDNNYPREIRTHSILYQADNVLTPQVIQTIFKQRKLLQEVKVDDKTFQDFCIEVPVPPKGGELFSCGFSVESAEPNEEPDDWTPFWGVTEEEEKTTRKQLEEESDQSGFNLYKLLVNRGDIDPSNVEDIDQLERLSNTLYPGTWCNCLENATKACAEENILELWNAQGSYSEITEDKIASLTQQDIINSINANNTFNLLKDFDFKDLLGNIRRNESGHIIGAGVVEMRFFTRVNVTDVKVHGTATRGEKIDYQSYKFEGEMVKLLQNKSDFPPGLTSLTNIQRQFFDSFVGQTFQDADKLGGGYVLVFIYVNIMLSKMNFVQQRFWLSVVGILSVAMGMIVGYGLCSLFGLFYSAAHTVIPFILLGIGIDNIFVITQTFSTIEATSSEAVSLPELFGRTMRHAGVAVSVTTFTDVIAFFVGTNTLLPGLQSFCVYAAVSIFTIYALQITHFVAWFSLDQRRQMSARDGCICCLRHKNFKPDQSNKPSILNQLFAKVGLCLTNKFVQFFVMLATLIFLAIGIWGTVSLTQAYKPEWLLPADSEVAKWFEVKNRLYSKFGEPGVVTIKKINISQEFDNFDTLVERLSNAKIHQNTTRNMKINSKVKTWHSRFRNYVNKFKDKGETFNDLLRNETFFRTKLTQFLFSPRGAIFQPYFEFSSKLVCGEPAPDVYLEYIPYTHIRFNDSSDWIPAMRETQRIVGEIPWSNSSFTMALTYINWETDAIVGIELLRNVGIAIICIFITTLVTLGSWRGSVFVMLCVLLTCLDVAGFMHFWGITIEITSMNIVIISVGLCVDFCAHIMHGFLTHPGTRSGCSTMLALSLLVTSRSHIFTSFFKIFLMICLFGLFHGLVMLPVLLCLIGPVDIQSEQNSGDHQKMFSLKFFRTLLREKYFKNNKSGPNSGDIKEMETLKTNGNQDVRDKLLQNKQPEEESELSPGSRM